MSKEFSFVTTVFNSSEELDSFIKSIWLNSVKPKEIIVVDGGSTDDTVAKLEKLKKSGIPLKIVVRKGANIAKGRNIGLALSKCEIVFTGDAGTVFEKHWFEKLLVGFSKGADIVVGKYASLEPKSLPEKISATRFPSFDSFTQEQWDSFLPSNRQIGFRKSSWRKLGPYPEFIARADDTLLHLKAKKLGLKYYYAKNAVVYWRARTSFSQYLKLSFADAKSDAVSGLLFKFKEKMLKLFFFLVFVLGILLSLVTSSSLFSYVSLLVLLFILAAELIRALKKSSVFVSALTCLFSILLFFAQGLGLLIGLAQGFVSGRE